MIDGRPQATSPRAAADWLKQRLQAGARLTADSRRVRAGDAFFGWPGTAVDGRRFWRQARRKGAAALVVEAHGWPAYEKMDASAAEGEARAADGLADLTGVAGDGDAAILAIDGLREQAGAIASAWHGEPSRQLDVVAVTGTNGKTSCTQWIAAGCNSRAGRDCGAVVGTLGSGIPGRLTTATAEGAASQLTTPDALEFQRLLAGFVSAGIEVVAVEASSIGLDQYRLDGTRIAVAVMTNLTRDHLDVHGTMAAYAEAKGRLFDWPGLAAAVVNLDDPVAASMLDRVAPGVRRIGYTLAPAAGPATDLVVQARAITGDGGFTLVIGAASAAVRIRLLGAFNLGNALAVAAVWHALGWPLADIAAALEALAPVPGRLEMVGVVGDASQPLVVIDYAHTPDALVNVLATLKPIAAARGGRLWCLFGAGGDRDRGKRPVMSEAVAAQADEIVLTSDNPRSEDPLAILADLAGGLVRPARYIEADRGRAIDRALAEAADADVILLAGKGHEDYQEIAGVRHPFSDLVVAQAAHQRRVAAGAPRGGQ